VTQEDATHRRRLATLCVRGTESPRPGEPLVPPVVRSTTFVLDDADYAVRVAGRLDRSRCYSRETSPTIEAVESHVASLEGAERALVFSSGTAALASCLLAFVRAGDRVVLTRQVYGGTFALVSGLVEGLGAELVHVDVLDHDALRGALGGRPRLLLLESLSNPLNHVADLPRVRELVDELSPETLVVCDATVSSPVSQRTLGQGVDLAFHSATKYLGGHTDLVGGTLSGREELVQRVFEWRVRAGTCMDPEGAALLGRGMKTLALRYAAQSRSAADLARFLDEHPRVERVHHCGLASHPSHAVAQRLLTHTGALFSFTVAGGDDVARGVLRRLELFSEAASFGGVESLATRPMDLSQAHLSAEARARAGIEPGLIRLAIGLEDVDDLREDLERGLA